jgi:hypothetical protein
MLPALYLPQDKTFQIPSVDFEKFKLAFEVTSVLGKMNLHASE